MLLLMRNTIQPILRSVVYGAIDAYHGDRTIHAANRTTSGCKGGRLGQIERGQRWDVLERIVA
jgi:hypothetical protein